MYDYDSCPCEQAAWRVYDLMCEHEPMYFEAHVTDDEESPNGFGWYFSSHLRNADGTWSEYDGGQYWDYESAEEFEGVIGEAVPFAAFEARPVEYEEFERVAFQVPRSLSEREAAARAFHAGDQRGRNDPVMEAQVSR